MTKSKVVAAFLVVAAIFFYHRTVSEQPSPSSSESSSPTAVIVAPTIDNKVEAAPTSSIKRVRSVNVTADNMVSLEGPVDLISVNKALRELQEKTKKNKEVYLLINSPGGSVLEGARVVSYIQSSPVKINTVCTKLCASMGFIIHQYGNKRMALDRAIIMAHPASGGARGQLHNMLSLLKTMQNYIDKLDAPIAARAGLSLAEFQAMTSFELWLDSEDALKRKFLDEIVAFDEPLDESPLIMDNKWENLKSEF